MKGGIIDNDINRFMNKIIHLSLVLLALAIISCRNKHQNTQMDPAQTKLSSCEEAQELRDIKSGWLTLEFHYINHDMRQAH